MRTGQLSGATPAIYAAPRRVTDLKECAFHHTIEIPGYGLVEAEWDLRDNARAYLGNVEFSGKRVLEVGVANGFLSFFMERQGAEVVGFDHAERHGWDMVPYAGHDYLARMHEYQAGLRRLGNGYWLAHRAFNSTARVVYGGIYEIPTEIGPVDITTFCTALRHVRDPFLLLQRALALTKETVVVTEPLSSQYWMPKLLRRIAPLRRAAEKMRLPLKLYMKVADASMLFLPRYWEGNYFWSWWEFSPEIIKRFIGALGFEDTTVTFHSQRWKDQLAPFFTVVGRRRKPGPVATDDFVAQP